MESATDLTEPANQGSKEPLKLPRYSDIHNSHRHHAVLWLHLDSFCLSSSSSLLYKMVESCEHVTELLKMSHSMDKPEQQVELDPRTESNGDTSGTNEMERSKMTENDQVDSPGTDEHLLLTIALYDGPAGTSTVALFQHPLETIEPVHVYKSIFNSVNSLVTSQSHTSTSQSDVLGSSFGAAFKFISRYCFDGNVSICFASHGSIPSPTAISQNCASWVSKFSDNNIHIDVLIPPSNSVTTLNTSSRVSHGRPYWVMQLPRSQRTTSYSTLLSHFARGDSNRSVFSRELLLDPTAEGVYCTSMLPEESPADDLGFIQDIESVLHFSARCGGTLIFPVLHTAYLSDCKDQESKGTSVDSLGGNTSASDYINIEMGHQEDVRVPKKAHDIFYCTLRSRCWLERSMRNLCTVQSSDIKNGTRLEIDLMWQRTQIFRSVVVLQKKSSSVSLSCSLFLQRECLPVSLKDNACNSYTWESLPESYQEEIKHLRDVHSAIRMRIRSVLTVLQQQDHAVSAKLCRALPTFVQKTLLCRKLVLLNATASVTGYFQSLKTILDALGPMGAYPISSRDAAANNLSWLLAVHHADDVPVFIRLKSVRAALVEMSMFFFPGTEMVDHWETRVTDRLEQLRIFNLGPLEYEQIEFPVRGEQLPATSIIACSYIFTYDIAAIASFKGMVTQRHGEMFLIDIRVNRQPLSRITCCRFIRWLFNESGFGLGEQVPDVVSVFYISPTPNDNGSLWREKLQLRRTKSGIVVNVDVCVEGNKRQIALDQWFQKEHLARGDKDIISTSLSLSACVSPWKWDNAMEQKHVSEKLASEIEPGTADVLGKLNVSVSSFGNHNIQCSFLPPVEDGSFTGPSPEDRTVAIECPLCENRRVNVELPRENYKLLGGYGVLWLGQSAYSWALLVENERIAQLIECKEGVARTMARKQAKITPQLFSSHQGQRKTSTSTSDQPVHFSLYQILETSQYRDSVKLSNFTSVNYRSLLLTRMTENLASLACRILPWDLVFVSGKPSSNADSYASLANLTSTLENCLGHRRAALSSSHKPVKAPNSDFDILRGVVSARVLCFVVDPLLYGDLLSKEEVLDESLPVVVAVDLFDEQPRACYWICSLLNSRSRYKDQSFGERLKGIGRRVESCIQQAQFLSISEVLRQATDSSGDPCTHSCPISSPTDVRLNENIKLLDCEEHSVVLDLSNCIQLAIMLTRSWIVSKMFSLTRKNDQDDAAKEVFSIPLWSIGSVLKRISEALMVPLSQLIGNQNSWSEEVMMLRSHEVSSSVPQVSGSDLIACYIDGIQREPPSHSPRSNQKTRACCCYTDLTVFSEVLDISAKVRSHRFVSAIGKLVNHWYLSAHKGSNHSLFLDSLAGCDFKVKLSVKTYYNRRIRFTENEEWPSAGILTWIRGVRAALATSLLEMDSLVHSQYGMEDSQHELGTSRIDSASITKLVSICEPFLLECSSRVFSDGILYHKAFSPEYHRWKPIRRRAHAGIPLGLVSEFPFWVLDKYRMTTSLWNKIMLCLSKVNFSSADPNVPGERKHIFRVRKTSGQFRKVTWLFQVYHDPEEVGTSRREKNVGAVYVCLYSNDDSVNEKYNRITPRRKRKGSPKGQRSVEDRPFAKSFQVLSSTAHTDSKEQKLPSKTVDNSECNFAELSEATNEMIKTYKGSIGHMKAKIIVLVPRENPTAKEHVKHHLQEIISETSALVLAAAHKANQIILMDDLHSKRVAETLLVPPSDQDAEYDYYYKAMIKLLANRASKLSTTPKKKQNARRKLSIDGPSLVGYFSAPRQAVVALPIHPQISKTNILGALATSVLSPFAIANRSDTFVYEDSQETSTEKSTHFISPPVHYIRLRLCTPPRLVYVLCHMALPNRSGKGKATIPDAVASLCKRTRQNFLLVEYFGLSCPSQVTISGIRRVIAQRLHSMVENSLFSVLARNPKFRLSRSHFYLVRRCQLANIANRLDPSRSTRENEGAPFDVLVSPPQMSKAFQLPLVKTAEELESNTPYEVSFVDVKTSSGGLSWQRELIVGFFARLQRDLSVWLTPVDSNYWGEVPSFPYFSAVQGSISESRPCPTFEDLEFDEDDVLWGRALAFGYISPPKQQAQSHLAKGRINPSHLQRRSKQQLQTTEYTSQDRRGQILEGVGQGFALVHVTLVSQQFLHEKTSDSKNYPAEYQSRNRKQEREGADVDDGLRQCLLDSDGLPLVNQTEEEEMVHVLSQAERLLLSRRWGSMGAAFDPSTEAEVLATAGQDAGSVRAEKPALTSQTDSSKPPQESQNSVTALSKLPIPRVALSASTKQSLFDENKPILLVQVWLPQKLQSKSWQQVKSEELIRQLKHSVEEAWRRTVVRSIEYIRSLHASKHEEEG